MKCAFCELVANLDRKVGENDLAWAFLTYIPITPGHTLVVPKRCVPNYEDLTDEEVLAIRDLTLKVQNSLKKTFQSKGFNLAWNQGKGFGQSVPHYHLHIVPRKEDDNGIIDYEPRKFLYRPGSREKTPEDELVKVAQLIKENIK